MSKMIYDFKEYNKVFIDPSRTTDGDGTTPAQALKDFPSTWEDNTAFIIRRTDGEVFSTVPAGATFQLSNIIIMGMPKTTNQMSNYLESVEKSLWGNDTAEYAQVRMVNTETSSPCASFPNIDSLLLFGCYFFKDTTGKWSNYCSETMFNIRSVIARVTVDNCKFGCFNADIDKDEYLANTSIVDYGYSRMDYYLNVSEGKSLKVKNSVINFGAHGSNGDGNYMRAAIGGRLLDKMLFHNNIINMVARWSHDNESDCVVRTSCVIYNNFSNNLINIIDSGSGAGFTGNRAFNCNIDSGDKDDCEVVFDNNKVRYKQMKDNVPVYSGDSSTALFFFDKMSKYKIKNFDFDLSESPYAGSCKVIEVRAPFSKDTNNEIENISIKYNMNSKISCLGGNYPSVKLYCDHGTTNDSVEGSSSGYLAWSMYSVSKAKKVNIQTLGAALYLHNFALESEMIKGQVYMYRGAYLKADNLVNPFGDRHAVEMTGYNNVLTVETLMVDKNNLDYPYNNTVEQVVIPDERYRYCNNIFISHCDAIPFLFTLSSNVFNYSKGISWVASDFNGLFIARNQGSSAKSWGVTREGTTAQASFKLETVTENSPSELVLGADPCTGFLLTPSGLGKKTITAFVGCSTSYASFSNMADKISLEAYVKQTDGTFKIYSSALEGSIEEDNSTWLGDTGVLPLKITLPVDIVTDGDVEVKVRFHWVDSVGYTYLDPELKIA